MFDILAIFCAKYLIAFSLVFATAFALKLSRKEQRSIIIFGVMAFPIIYLTALVAGHFYNNPRPFVVEHFVPLIPHGDDNGFPSDHVLLASAIASIWTIYSKRIGLILWGAALLIGIARVYVGVHHTIDVMGSALIAAVVSWGLYLLMKKFKYLV